jgi:hypothetical protein
LSVMNHLPHDTYKSDTVIKEYMELKRMCQ